MGAGATFFGAPDYPAILAGIPDPPAVLFHSGGLSSFLAEPSVAVIGSRRASQYGLGVARTLSSGLAAAGVGVVSGLARGIDAEAHRSCLAAGGRTLAVLGSGLDVIYPPEHAGLARDIAAGGVLVTEHCPGSPPDAWNFPQRNRLISGFSLAVVVVEAGDRSGTMITVDAALDQGRDVFAVPGEITRAGSRGTNRLLREGAMMATCPGDILEALGIASRPPRTPCAGPDGPSGAILRLLEAGPMHFDQIALASGARVPDLQALLVALEMTGSVVQRQGGWYSRT